MTKMSLARMINGELKKLNEQIDKKIVKGQSYFRESRRHRDLRLQLRRVESEASLTRSLSFVSFLF